MPAFWQKSTSLCFWKVRLGRVVTLLAVLSTLLVWAAPAQAESAADRATARALAKEGFEALKTGDFETAEDRFRRADALVHAPTLVVDHARSLVGLGRLVEAHERYELVIREGVDPNASGPWKRAYADAQREIEELKGRLAWLTIKVVGPEQPEVTIDGKPIPAAAIGVRRATDPGERTIVAGGAGYLPKEESLDLDEGEEQVLEFELEPDPNASAQEEAAAAPASATRDVQANPDFSSDRMYAYAAFGVGGVGIIAGSVTGLLALRKRSQLNKECDNGRCPDESSQGKIDTYHTLGTISGIAYGVGIAGVAAGATLLLLSGQSGGTGYDTESASVAPYFTGNSVGVHGRF